MKIVNFVSLMVLLYVGLDCHFERSYGMSVKFVPRMKKTEFNHQWLNTNNNVRGNEFPLRLMAPLFHSRYDDWPKDKDQMEDESNPLIQEKRGLFDLGTGRGYSGFQAMRGNLGLAFAGPGAHGK